MKNLGLVVISILCIAFLGCNNKGTVSNTKPVYELKYKDGVATSYYTADQIREKFDYKESDGKKIKEGDYIIYYENGKVWQEGEYLNNQLHGEWKTYKPTGVLHQLVHYQNGKKEGLSIVYHPGGAEYQKINYKNDMIQDTLHIYYENGDLMEIAYYDFGVKQGISKGYYPDGELSFELSFKDGLEHGEVKTYYKNGKIKDKAFKENGVYQGEYIRYYKDFNEGLVHHTCTYVDGKIHGEYIGYHPNKKVSVRSNYTSGLMNGTYEEFYEESGALKETGNMVNSQRSGPWKAFYDDGSLYLEGNYKNNQFQGEWKAYYPNGNLKQKGSYTAGLADGPWEFYYENGNLKEKGNYKEDQKVGIWKMYDESGNFVKDFDMDKTETDSLAQ